MKDVDRPGLPLHAVAVLAVMACPALAEAHLNSTGMGPVYDGVVHFVTSPEDMAPVLALALLAGLRGADHGRRALFVLPVAWLLGGLLGTTASATSGGALSSAIGVLFLGGLLATDAKLSLGVTTVLAGLLGLSRGYLNGSGMGQLRGRGAGAPRPGFGGVRPGRARGRGRGLPPRPVGPDRRARRGKLDRSQRALDARLGRPRTVRPTNTKPNRSHRGGRGACRCGCCRRRRCARDSREVGAASPEETRPAPFRGCTSRRRS